MSKTAISTIDEIRKEIGNAGQVVHLPLYPKEDLYIQVKLLGIPFKIERGHDIFFYNGYKTSSKRHLWYVARSDIENPDLYIEKGFQTLSGALSALIKTYRAELSEQIKRVESFERFEKLTNHLASAQ